MKYRYKLLELRRNRDGLLRFLELCDIEPKESFDNPQNLLKMDEKLALCAEITRIQKQITRIEAMPHGRIDDDCGDFEIMLPSKMNYMTSWKSTSRNLYLKTLEHGSHYDKVRLK